MVLYKCYKINELLNLLGNNFYVVDENVESRFSDWNVSEVEVERDRKFYITNKDVLNITEWYGLWSETVVTLRDGTKLKLYSDNMNRDDKSLIRKNRNDFFSPSFQLQDEYILASKDLDEWIEFNGLSKEQTDKVSVSFEVYPMYIFEGIKEPIIRNEKICGCYGYDMKISEDKIDKALSCIKDTEMRLKIQHILKSFHKRY